MLVGRIARVGGMKWIFLPGMDGSGTFFDPFLKGLPADVEPVTIRFPPGRKLGYEELCQWLSPRLPQTEPYLVVAESFSGPLAVRLAAQQPVGMTGAVVSASFVRYPLPCILAHLPLELFFRRRLPRFLVRCIFADESAPPELYTAFYRAIEDSAPPYVAHRARAALGVDETEALKVCRLPLLFLEATKDRLIPRWSMKLVRELRPDLPMVQIPAPHFLLQLKPKECLRAIEEFLEQSDAESKRAQADAPPDPEG